MRTTDRRCMGRRENAAQCATCARLPRTEEDEDTSEWIQHNRRTVPCDRYHALVAPAPVSGAK